MIQIVDENIILDKTINDLDRFVLDFIKILERHTRYVIVSGYVSIFFGRSRGTEDVDCFIELKSSEILTELWSDITRSFECMNCSSAKQWEELIHDGISLRFCRKGVFIPNMEVKIVKSFLDKVSLERRIKVQFGGEELWMSPIELQIAYKRKILCSEKDMEDARHLESALQDIISLEKIKYYESVIDTY